jgi:membrane-bound metal-dependent hydrolase YbcI (DUF457 family)
LDFGFFGLALAGIEKFRITPGITKMVPLDLYHMPYTHSLLGSAVWAAGFALLIWLFTGNRIGAMIGGLVVLSHWFLDLLVHAPDLTLAGSLPKLGFALWNYPMIEMPLELAITFGALAFFVARTRPIALSSKFVLVLLAILLGVFQVVNWFTPEPETATMGMMITALIAFAVASVAAFLVGKTRMLKQV